MVADGCPDAEHAQDRLLLIDRIATFTRLCKIREEVTQVGNRERGDELEPGRGENPGRGRVINGREKCLAEARTVKRHARSDSWIGSHIPRVAEDLVDIHKLAMRSDRQHGGAVSCSDESLEGPARNGPQFQAIACIQPQLDQSGSELIPSPAILRYVAPGRESVDQAMGAAACEAEPAADLRDRQTAWLTREQLEDVEGPVRRLDR